jgi:acylphosphatase
MPSSYRFVVTGRVQGVGFRAATRRKAQSLGLTGWVRNRNDGAVEGVASSRDAKSLESFHCSRGHRLRASNVSNGEPIAPMIPVTASKYWTESSPFSDCDRSVVKKFEAEAA